jgi:hypothetical protein
MLTQYDIWSPLADLNAAMDRAQLPPLAPVALDDTTIDVVVQSAVNVAGQQQAAIAAGEHTNFEMEKVHPPMAVFVKAVLRHGREKLDATHALGSVELYTEDKGRRVKKSMSRKDDNIMHFHINSKSTFLLDRTVQHCAMMAGELKWLITRPNNRGKLSYDAEQAVNGLQRDYANSLPALPRAELPFGLGYISDGVHFALVRTEMTENGVKSICSEAYDLRDKGDVHVVVDLLTRALIVAASQCHTFLYAMPSVSLGGRSELAVKELLSETSNSIVFRFQLAKQSFIGKHLRGERDDERLFAEVAVWNRHGALLRKCDRFVQLAPLTTTWCSSFIMVYEDDSAMSLKQLRSHGLIDTIIRDVGAALKHLHKAGLAFFDLHPGQIVVTGATGNAPSAKLIDVETICAIENEPADGRRLWCLRKYEPRLMHTRPIGATSDAESFALIIAWLNGIDFDDDDGAKTRAIGNVHRSIFAAPFDGLNLREPNSSTTITLTSLCSI